MKNVFITMVYLWRIAHTYYDEVNSIRNAIMHQAKAIHELNSRIGEHTSVHVDINPKTANQVIVIGRYKSTDYVRVFEVQERHIPELVNTLKNIEQDAGLGRVDTVGPLDVSAVYIREWWDKKDE